MKTYEEFKLKDLLIKKDIEIPKKDITYHEGEPITIVEIFDKFGGINDFNYKEVSKYLANQYVGKKIKLVYDNGSKDIDSVFKVSLSVFYNMETQIHEINIDFYSTPNLKHGIGDRTKIIILYRRNISDIDPYGEEVPDDD